MVFLLESGNKIKDMKSTNDELYISREGLKSKRDFDKFLDLLFKDYKENPEKWENITLNDFLEALSAYSKNIDGYYKNFNIEYDFNKPTWKMFADILLGAKVYE